jgi:hypothetical protein
MPMPSWQPDPYRRHQFRWWDGSSWTAHVSDRGIESLDPPVGVPPVSPRAGGNTLSSRQPNGLVAAAAVAVVVLFGATLVFLQRGDDGNGLTTTTSRPSSSSPARTVPRGSTLPGPAPAAGPLTPGAFTPVSATTIGPAGGTVSVSGTGTPVDGLSVEVPEGSFPADQIVAVAWAPLSGTDPTGLVTPASPLIRIDDGGKYSDDIITVTVPASIPDGWFAMGFYRDPSTGRLEGLPLLRGDATSVVIGTRHFSEFFIGAVEELLLPETVDTGFDPNVDMWQFPNWGSAVAKGGHCAGMSLTAMWFFLEQKAACGCTLRGRYDNEQAFNVGEDTPDFWFDDARGLKWATTVQRDVPWRTSTYYDSAWKAMYRLQSELQLDAFRFSMAVTHEPQFVLLSTPTGSPVHAMVAYGIEDDGLVIADPNTPDTNPDWISYDPATRTFLPFVSGVTADGPTITFGNIGYAAKSALFDWTSIGSRFAEAEAGTIGMDRFDSFDLVAVELDPDGMEVHNVLTADYVPQRNPIPVYAISPGHATKVRATFYPGTSTTAGPVAEISTSAESTRPTSGSYAPLDAMSIGTYGVLIEEWVQVGVDAAGTPQFAWRWADFQRFRFGTVPPPTTPAPPATTAPSDYDCTQPRPTDLEGRIEWDLHCTTIQPSPTSP